MRLYSDDFGYNRQVDKGIIRLIKRGKLIGVSVLSSMVNPLSLNRLKRIIAEKNNFILGLHINLIEGDPLQTYVKIMSLSNSNGKFFPLLIFLARLFFGRIDQAEIKLEIESQLAKLREKGFVVRMLDSHQHTHAFSPVAEIVAEVAHEQNIPLVRNFGSIKTHSLKAKITYAILKLFAFLSYLLAYKKFGLPASWGLKQKYDWTVMSWEGKTFSLAALDPKKAALIIHPYLPFDTNKSYLRFINSDKSEKISRNQKKSDTGKFR